MKTTLALSVFGVLFLAMACGQDTEFERVQPPVSLDELSGLEGSGATAGLEGGTLLDLEAGLLTQADPSVTTNEARERVLLTHRLAQLALEQGLGEEFSVVNAWRSALARRRLEVLFHEEHTPEKVPMEVWKQMYSDPRIFRRFDHHESYYVMDVQYVCCTSPQADVCRRDPATLNCINSYHSQAQQIRDVLSFGHPRNKEEFETIARDIQATTNPELGVMQYSFYYDYSKPHSEQKGFTVLSEPVVQAARKAGVGGISDPVADWAGWHILYVVEHQPEERLKLGDPRTLEIFQTEFYDQVVAHDAIQYINDLAQKYSIQYIEESIQMVDWQELSGTEF